MTSPIDFTHPQTSDNYSTAFVPAIIANQVAQAMWLDSAQTTYTAGLQQYMKRFNSATGLFEQYSGSAWATLATNYATWAGGAFTGMAQIGTGIAAAAPNATNIAATASAMFSGSGGNFLSVGQYPSSLMTWIQSSFSNPTTACYSISLQPLGGNVGIGVGANLPGNALVVWGAGSPLVLNSTNSYNTKIQLQDATATRGYWQSYSGVPFSVVNAAGSLSVFNVDNSGNANTALTSVCPQFIASGNPYGVSAVMGSGSAWYRAMMYNDGSSCFLMPSAVQTTQLAAQTAGYGTLRPFSYNLSSGSVIIDGTGAGTSFGGNVSMQMLSATAVAETAILNCTNGNAAQLQFNASGTSEGYIGANSSYSLSVINGTGGLRTFTVDQSGNGGFSGGLVAPGTIQFGSGVSNLRSFNYYGEEFSWQQAASTTMYVNCSDTSGNNGSTYQYTIRGLTSSGGAQANLAAINLLATTVGCGGGLTAVGNISGNSDERLKTNWRGLGDFDYIDFLTGIKSGVYDRTDIDLTQIGVSAQDVQKLVPHAVTADAGGTLSIAYGQFAAVSCVELAKEIQNLRGRIAELECAQ